MQNRTNIVKVRMTDKEKIKLQEMAEKSGRSVSSYIRAKLFGGEAATINAVEFLEQYKTQIHEMQKIGNNINQLAHYANICKNSNKLSEDVVNEMNDHMADLVRCERELIAVHKRLR